MPHREIPSDASAVETPGEVDSVGANRVSTRTVAFVFAALALALACGLFALKYFVGERLPELTEARFEAAQSLWQKNGPANYYMEIELRGAQPGNIQVEVRNNEVTGETRDGKEPGRWTWDTWSVPGMFDTLGQDLQIAANPQQEIQAAPGTKWRLRCEFDPKLGFPWQYHRTATDGPEVFWRVSRFEAR